MPYYRNGRASTSSQGHSREWKKCSFLSNGYGLFLFLFSCSLVNFSLIWYGFCFFHDRSVNNMTWTLRNKHGYNAIEQLNARMKKTEPLLIDTFVKILLRSLCLFLNTYLCLLYISWVYWPLFSRWIICCVQLFYWVFF